MAAPTAFIDVRWRIQGADLPWQQLRFPGDSSVVTLPGVMRGQVYDGEARAVADNGQVSEWVPVSWSMDEARQGAAALPVVSTGNVGSRWVAGATVTYSTTDTEATISVSAGTLQVGSTQIAYNASSTTLAGTAGQVVRVFLYYDDPFLAGGTRTLGLTTDPTASVASNGRVLITDLVVTFAATGGTGGGGGGIGGGGGGSCVSVDSYVIERERGIVPAGTVGVGEWLMRGDGSFGRVTFSQTRTVPGVRIVGDDMAALECSTTAPIECGDGFRLAPDMLGRTTPAFPGLRRVIDIVRIGDIAVQHITLAGESEHDHVFRASHDGVRWWAHHNLKNIGETMEP